MQFSDSIQANIDLITELLSGLPPGARNRAKLAASTIEKAFTSLQQDHSKDPATALGAAFAVYMIAQRMVERSAESDKLLIQLLS